MIEINCPAGPALLLHRACPVIDRYGARRLSREATTPPASSWVTARVDAASTGVPLCVWGSRKRQWVREQAQEEVSPW